MQGKIFINYRRDDDPGATGRLFDRLEAHFERDQLFMDVDSIAPGLDFVKVLSEKVTECDVLLAVIGRGWLDAADVTGARRLDNPADFVRIEIETALDRGIRVIPVLMNRAIMPPEDGLPPSLKPLAHRNAVRLSHDRFKADCDTLIEALQKALKQAERERQMPGVETPPPRTPSPEQSAKAEELMRWEAIKLSLRAEDFADHLARFPDGPTSRLAQARMEQLQRTALAQPELIAALALPFQIVMALLFELAGWNFVSGTKTSNAWTSGVIVGLILFVITVALLAYRRRKALGAREASLYWLACVLAALPAVGLSESASGMAVFLSFIFVSAAALCFIYRRMLGGADIATYWLGCCWALLIGVTMLFYSERWNWLGVTDNGSDTGLLLGVVAALVSAASLIYWQRPVGGVALSIYWLGFLIPASLLIAVVFKNLSFRLGWGDTMTARMGIGFLVTLALGIISAFLLVYPRRRTVTAGELKRYWFGCSLIAIFALGCLVQMQRWNFAVGALIACALSALAALLLASWWRENRQEEARVGQA
jgi:hypothetical protein